VILTFATDVAGRLTANEAAPILIGRRTDNWDILWSYVHPRDVVRERAAFEAAIYEGRHHYATYRVRCRDGRYRGIHLDMWPVYSRGRIIGFRGTIEIAADLAADVSIAPLMIVEGQA
jgi:PAS domain-containing protein